MRPFQIVVVLVLLFTSCKDHTTSKAVEKSASDSAKESKQDTALSSTKSGSLNKDFLNFWQKFRTAVINNDTAQIIELTEFPFQTRGQSDYDPTIEYSKKKFIKVFRSFLNQWNGQDLDDNTELDVIKKTELPNKDDVQGDYARVGNLVFDKSGKNWKLVFAYLNDNTIEFLKK